VSPGVRLPPFLLLVFVLHTAVFPQLRMFGVTADVLLVVAVAAGIAGGPERGATIGFTCGLLADLVLRTPFGLSALAYCIVGWSVGVFQSRVLHAVWWIPVLTAAAASAAGTALFVLVGAVVGQDQLVTSRLPTIVGVVALWGAILVLPVARAVRWAVLVDPVRDRRVLR
jgi:rod shape-determining protein MreD